MILIDVSHLGSVAVVIVILNATMLSVMVHPSLNDTQRNNIQHNDTQQKVLKCDTHHHK